MKLGTIEGGGTKFVVGVGDENGNIFERESFPTTTPEETMKKTIEFFKDKGVEAIGFGSFGPIDQIRQVLLMEVSLLLLNQDGLIIMS